MDEQIRQRVLLSSLFDIYGPILTQKQSEAFTLHFLNDLSLSEVSERLDVSRQGAHDLVQRGRERLLEIEALLGFAAREAQWYERSRGLRSWAERFSEKIPPQAVSELNELLNGDRSESEVF